MGIRTKLIKDLMSLAEAYKEGETSAIGTMTDMGILLENFMKAESQKSAIPPVSDSHFADFLSEKILMKQIIN